MKALLYLEELSGEGKYLHSLRQPSRDGNYAGLDYETALLRFQCETYPPGFGFPDESLKQVTGEKTEMCRYFSMPGGCVRGEKCFYAHREEDLQGRPKSSAEETKALNALNPRTTSTKLVQRVSEDLSKKIFVGGLSPSVESDNLREFFEGRFGAVGDAIVIGSHSGDHVQSRGFGFVTFKNEDSVIAAVQAHYVNIFGKKAEIKGAVPRSVLPTLECVKGGLELLTTSSASEPSTFSEVDLTKVHDMPSLELLCQAKGDLQVQAMNYMGYDHAENGESVPAQVQGVLSSAAPRSSCATGQNATWVTRFKKWLPTFLAGVSNRLKEGECYPLSSLKGDFRATCGLELDYVAIGYHKLSDFVRSIPESCRLKIVPVGRGPATHMVLLPALARLNPTGTVQTPKLTRLSAYSALVDAGRSYAAVTSEVPGRSNSVPFVNTRSLIPQLELLGNSTGQFESHKVRYSTSSLPRSRYDEAKLSEKNSTRSHTPLVDTPEGSSIMPSISQVQVGSSIQEADLTPPRDLLALMENCEGKHGAARVATTGTDYLTANRAANNSNNPGQAYMARPGGTVVISTDSLIDPLQDDPKTLHQVNLRSYSTFNHPVTGVIPHDHANNYSMWGRYPGQQVRTSQDSPHSVLHPYDRKYSQIGSQETTSSSFSTGGNSPTDYKPWTATCVCCRERQSLWVAIPCNHYALCSVCKDALNKLSLSNIKCPVCTRHLERWMALHY